jgi:hypothetical protein
MPSAPGAACIIKTNLYLNFLYTTFPLQSSRHERSQVIRLHYVTPCRVVQPALMIVPELTRYSECKSRDLVQVRSWDAESADFIHSVSSKSSDADQMLRLPIGTNRSAL